MSEKLFPVLWHFNSTSYRAADCPRFVPWGMISPHEKRASTNHGQSLERLAARGGLGVQELVAVIEDLPWSQVTSLTDALAVKKIKKYVADYETAEAASKEETAPRWIVSDHEGRPALWCKDYTSVAAYVTDDDDARLCIKVPIDPPWLAIQALVIAHDEWKLDQLLSKRTVSSIG